MSLFKKPKRNLRIRGVGDNEDCENDETETDSSSLPENKIAKKKVTTASNQPVLSFQEDWNDGDDGEIFQVKKSSQSKKIKKLLDRERKKKKDSKLDLCSEGVQEKSNKVTTQDDIVIKLKNTFPVLNGREAEAANQEGVSSEEEDEVTMGHVFMKQSDDVKLMLKRGKIPDAATIHAARKQRQHVREMGDFIPLSDETSRYDNTGTGSRLIREDDNDASEGEEERINMAINTTDEDRMRRRVEFRAAQDIGSGESDKGEEEEWEAQQIRKGVTGAQIAAVQQENLYYQQYIGANVGITMSLGCETAVETNSAEVNQGGAVFPPLPSTGAIDPNLVTSKLKERLQDLREVHRKHCADTEKSKEEVVALKKECDSLITGGPKLAEKFRYYQDLRGYVTDLVECLDEKIVVVEMLEQRVEALFSRRSLDYVERRRRDVMDQAQELAPTASKGARIERDEALVRRIAEREGRRIRRQRARELKGITNHVEGMSSDEEVTEAEVTTVRAQREVIEQDARHVFEDTLDEFATIRGILQRFEAWRTTDMDAYKEAYVSLCLPKLLGPILRLKLLFWNPITQPSNELEKAPWCNSIFLYGLKDTETEASLRADPDVQLLPRIIDKIILPKLNQLVSLCWDPLSNSQTVSLVGLVTRLMQEYPTLTHNSKSVTNLINTVIDKMRETVENDVYIPIYPKQRFQESKINNFFTRQCAIAVKLLGNLVCWQGLLSDTVLSEIALESLLNRYLLSAMRTCQPLQAVNICNMIGSVLPRIWLQTNSSPHQLISFLNQAKLIAQQLDPEKPAER
ncbi:hypothetical protein AAG570_011359 [Ranatra chinensis]|uniref:GCF C-terminal domain-containing protein n=1 Tax=Ranatra chinensis TaxID=642074 RepID=A0ABD0YKE0_9HEMI